VTADLSGSAGDDGSSEDGPVGARDSIGADVERLTGGHGDDVLVGNNVAHVLVGGAGDDVLKGQEGNDQLTGGTGQDSLSGGDGNDTLSGGSSDDMLAGGEGNDTVDGGADGDTLAGGPGVDTATYASRTAPLVVSIGAGGGDDGEKLDGPVGERDTVRASVENLVGGASSDSLTGNDLDNTLTGGLGKDTLKGLAGVDTLIANDGVADTLIDCGGDTDNPAQVDGLDPAPVSCP
jgi:Ca2+-binding RTX toxin-like protein